MGDTPRGVNASSRRHAGKAKTPARGDEIRQRRVVGTVLPLLHVGSNTLQCGLATHQILQHPVDPSGLVVAQRSVAGS